MSLTLKIIRTLKWILCKPNQTTKIPECDIQNVQAKNKSALKLKMTEEKSGPFESVKVHYRKRKKNKVRGNGV